MEHGIDEYSDYEFIVHSLINKDDETSKIMDSYMDGAEEIFLAMVKDGEWEERNVIWLRSKVDFGNGYISVFRYW